MMIALPMSSALAPAAVVATTRPWWFLPLLLGSALLLLIGIFFVVWLLLSFRKRQQIVQPTPPSRGIDDKRLTGIWETFQGNLPSEVRAAVPEYSHFLVLGSAGAGKSTLIQRKVDWQGQTSQFLPSYMADPLLQIYLGSKTIVQELTAPLLESTSRATNRALERLFRRVDSEQPPTVVLVLKASSLKTATPDEIRQQAQLMRGKVNLLSQSFGVPIPTRICLTHMDRTHGYSELVRFLKRNRIPFELPIGTDAGLTAGLQAYEKHLPRALTSLPVGPFQANVEFLLAAEDTMGPLGSFLQALLEGGLTTARLDLQKLYFFSPAPDEQVGNPFQAAAPRPGQLRPLSWLRRFLYQLGLQPLHAAIGAALVLAGLIAMGVVTRRHSLLVQRAAEQSSAFAGTVQRALEKRSAPSESAAVRSSERQASQAPSDVREAERRFRPLRLLFRPEKKSAQQRFVDAVRAGYLAPELDRGVRKRLRERILYALVALYSTNRNTLGALVRAQPRQFAETIEVSSDILLDYVEYSDTPWRELALRLLPPLPSEDSRWPVRDLRPWREFVGAVNAAIPLPYLSPSQLKQMQEEAVRLLEALANVRKAGTLRQIFQALAEESPLDLVQLFGRNAGALVPHPWLVDHSEPLEQLLTLVRDSTLQFSSGGHMSLFRLLKWINDLSENRLNDGPGKALDKLEDERYFLPFPDEQPSEISRRAWLELLLRSRKRLLLATHINTVEPSQHGASGRRHHKSCCGCAVPKKRKRPRASESCSAGSAKEAVPLWNRDEIAPKLASLINTDDTPSDGLDELYNRVVLEKEVLPLIGQLKQALGTSKSLTPDEKIQLSRLVKSEVGGYAKKYCTGLRRFYLGYRFQSASSSSLHSELLSMTSPGAAFLSHLRTVADNVRVTGLDEPYMQLLSQCLAELQPIAALIYPPAGAAASPGLPEGLKPYKAAVYKLVGELDGGQSDGAGSNDPASPLAERLGPLGKSTLKAVEGRGETALRMVEKFLDEAGVGGELRQPFLSPFNAAYRQGAREIEKAMAEHWQVELLPQVAQLFTRFPFSRAADREVSPSELDVLSEAKGAFWQDFKTFYAPVLSERGGTYQQKSAAANPVNLTLPQNMLPTVNRLTELSRALFAADGSRKPLKLAVRGLPGRTVQEERSTQNTTAFLQVGRAAAYGFNQQAAAVPLSIDWWEQGVAMVGVESTTSKTERRQTQSIEVADSAWSLFRMLQKSTLDRDGVSTWRLLGDGSTETQALRFVITPDPWNLFQVQLP